MGAREKVSKLVPGEQVVSAVFIAEPMSTAIGAGVGGLLGAAIMHSNTAGSPSPGIAARFPRQRSALVVTRDHVRAFPYVNFKGLVDRGIGVGPREVARCRVDPGTQVMRPKVFLEFLDGSGWAGRLESRNGAREFARALDEWHRNGTAAVSRGPAGWAAAAATATAPPPPRVVGVSIDVPADGGRLALVAAADGTTTYTAVGGGTFDVSVFAPVTTAAAHLLRVLTSNLAMFPTQRSAVVPADHIQIALSTSDGHRWADLDPAMYWGRTPSPAPEVLGAIHAVFDAIRVAYTV